MNILHTTLRYAECILIAWSSCVMSSWNKMMFKSFFTKGDIMQQTLFTTYIVKRFVGFILFLRTHPSWMKMPPCPSNQKTQPVPMVEGFEGDKAKKSLLPFLKIMISVYTPSLFDWALEGGRDWKLSYESASYLIPFYLFSLF